MTVYREDTKRTKNALYKNAFKVFVCFRAFVTKDR